MTISLRISPNISALAKDLAQVLSAPADPLHQFTVVVPTGLKRWLIQQLSLYIGASQGRYDGVAAGINFIPPSRVVQAHQRVEFAGWQRGDLLWEIFAVLNDLTSSAERGEPREWAEPLMQYLNVERARELRRRKYHVARKTAALFNEYLTKRPDMLREWRDGVAAVTDDADTSNEFSQAVRNWQAPLWRLVDERLASGLAVDGGVEGRNSELFMFMPWDIPQSLAQALQWWEKESPVRIWWQSSAAEPELVPQWGHHQQAIWNQLQVLASTVEHIREPVPESPEHGVAVPESVRFYPCPSRGRQVEVLRDSITAAFEDDASLQPRDVLVLCPNVAEFEPHIRAAFAPTKNHLNHPARGFPLAIAAANVLNPIAEVVAMACVAIPQRGTSQQLLDLFEQAPVREKYEIEDDQLVRMRSWVSSANIRWGLTQDHAGVYGLDQITQNTWDDGLNRLALGAAAGEVGQWGGVAAVADIGSQEVELLGKVEHLIAVLEEVRSHIAEGRTGAQWGEVTHWLLDEITPSSFGDGTERLAVDQFLASLADVPEVIGPDEFVDQLELAMQNSGRAQYSGTGAITVSDISEIAHIPHRMVILLGFDEGTYPRSTEEDGDNLLDLEQLDSGEGQLDLVHTGARDRHLFSAAVRSVTDALVVIYSGFDPGSQVSLPPAMVISELAEALEIDLTRGSQDPRVQHQHLRAHDAKNFCATQQPPAFDPVAARWARELHALKYENEVSAEDPWLEKVAAATTPSYVPAETITLGEIKYALVHPLRAFVERRLNVARAEDETELPIHIPIELGGLQRWKVGQQLLDDLVSGHEFAPAFQRASQQGILPPGELLCATVETMGVVQQIADEALRFMQGNNREGIEVELEAAPNSASQLSMNGGPRSTRIVHGVAEGVAGSRIVRATYSSFKAERLLHMWIDMVAAVAMGYPIERGNYIFRAERIRNKVKVVLPHVFEIMAPSRSEAQRQLQKMVHLYDAVMCEPIPVATRTGYTFVNTAMDPKKSGADGLAALDAGWGILKGTKAWASAAASWDSSWDGDAMTPEVGLLYSGKPWFTGGGRGIADQEVLERDGTPRCRSRFGHYALEIWEPMLSNVVNRSGVVL